jgi:diguanylate cyclase (GGDEF)-like protein
MGSLRDLVELVQGVRRSVVALTAGAYLATMTASTFILATTSRLSPVAAIGLTALVGIIALLVAVALLERMLGRTDRLGRISVELSGLYDRARLDALRDSLTGLGNHRAFQEELDRAVEMARRHKQSTALLLIDVDDLKRTNETEGHAAGDEVLRSVARVMEASLRRIDRAFRIDGDEFAVLSPGASAEMALAFGRRIMAAALERDPSHGQQPISLTIGVSAVPDPSSDRKLLFRHAAAALSWGKRHGRTDIQVYDPTLQSVAGDDRSSEELAAAIGRVVEQGLLRPAFQPIYSLTDGVCVGFEGLVRPGPGSGFRNATDLFVAAEAVNRTVELDLAAVRVITAGARHLPANRYLAVNLSPRTIEAAAFNPHEVLSILADGGIESRRLVIEVTEREVIEDMARLAANLHAIRRTGARIAADDVGSGNAGLQLLSQVDFDVIKIDLSLVQSGPVLAPSRAVVRALIDMAERRGATTVAEGIETPIQLEVLRELGIRVGQGYLLGHAGERPDAGRIDLDALLGAGDGRPRLAVARVRAA